MATMITIEVRGQRITWPEDFATVMIGYYQKHGVPFMIHGACTRNDWRLKKEK